MSNQEILREKANLVYEHCASVGLPKPHYRVTSEYAVDLYWQYEGKKHTLSLYYKASLQRWTLDAKTDWLRQVVTPSIRPLFERLQVPKASLSSAHSAIPKQETVLSKPQIYFTDALAIFSLLAPFADDNVDFSVICHYARLALRMTLSNPDCSHLDQGALETIIDIPDKCDFFGAKEYLIQCLTLCNINNVVN